MMSENKPVRGGMLARLWGNPSWLALVVGVWLGSLGNIALWRVLWRLPEAAGWHAVSMTLGLFALISGLQIAFLALFAWRWTFKPVLILSLVIAALGANFMLTYGVVIDKSMIVNVMQTDVRESTELLSLPLLLALAVIAVLPGWWLWRRPLAYGTPWAQVRRNLLTIIAALLLAVTAVMLTFQSLAPMMRNHKQLRFMINPLNTVYALGQLALEPFAQPRLPMRKLGTDAHPGKISQAAAKPALLVLVVGETARAANFSLNGYARPTNPELAQEDVLSFRNVYSCGTSTAASVPCMFSHLGRGGYAKRDADYEGLLDVLKHGGVSVVWRDNNSGCKGTCAGVTYEDMTPTKDAALCASGECWDEVMLDRIDDSLHRLNGGRAANTVIVLHQKGSHGPAYYLRSPPAFKAFMPECQTNILQNCTRAEVINAYDNTIRYTDHMLARTIAWLKSRQNDYDTAMLYISDHGESLGENNTYLHGLPYLLAPDVQKHVPMIVWLSPQISQRTGITTACLGQDKDKALSHDNLFHSVLGLMDVQTAVYRPELDFFRSCMAK